MKCATITVILLPVFFTLCKRNQMTLKPDDLTIFYQIVVLLLYVAPPRPLPEHYTGSRPVTIYDQVEWRKIGVNNVILNVIESGPTKGPLLLLLQ